ncbi:hypothetical protein [Streptomyces sp. YGL11-2]|uniref:hypothetical protein n=1 Tax=Streptomyces sp. YGL11-2 TaxID=3414028 RepID=UPI003CF8A20A
MLAGAVLTGLATAAGFAAVLNLGAAPAAAARPGPLRQPPGDNCAFAGTAPPVRLPTDLPVPPGWHIPCTKPTPRPRPAPTFTPAPPPAPSRAPAPRPRPLRTPAPAGTPRPAPPTPYRRPTPADPPPATPTPARQLAAPVPAMPRSYSPVRPQPPHGHSVVTRTLLVTTPALLAAAALRPRSRSASRSAGRSSS